VIDAAITTAVRPVPEKNELRQFLSSPIIDAQSNILKYSFCGANCDAVIPDISKSMWPRVRSASMTG